MPRNDGTLTRDEVAQLRDGLTMGDHEYARDQSGEDAEKLIKHALFRAAQRGGLISPAMEYTAFLDTVRMSDLQAIVESERPKEQPPSSPPGSSTTGE